MHIRILALAVTAMATLPLSANAQQRVIVDDGVTTGMVAVSPSAGIITETQRPHFRQYIVEEQVPSYTVEQPIEVGTTLPEAGVTYYDVPERFGATTFRYTVVNDHSILVDPRTRRIMQVIE
jgi:hypothetical protein